MACDLPASVAHAARPAAPSLPPARAYRFPVLRLAILASLGWLSASATNPGLESTPLAPRSVAPGRTLFTALPAEQTGVVCPNVYGDPHMWGRRYTELMNGSLGTGVAVADYDNDGRLDLFAVSKTGPSRLFRNLGGWKFSDVTVAAGLLAPAEVNRTDRPDWAQGAAWADVDNDGRLDLYVCRFNAPNQLFMNQGDGTFREEAAARGLALVDASGLGVFFDYDRDGDLDVYVQTNLLDTVAAPNGQRDHLFENRGDGTFTDVSTRAGITGENLAHAAIVWDYNEDGWPDLYVANDFTAPDRLYHNNRDGTFRDVIHDVVPLVPYSAMGADAGDINNDGLADFLVADMAATTHEKDQRGMAYSRTLKNNVPEPPPHEVPQSSRNALFLNTGAGKALEIAHLAGVAATDWTWSVRFEDLDNDGRLDLHVTNGMIREYQNVDLLDRMVLAENQAERVGVMRGSPRLDEANLAFRNRGDLAFEPVGPAWGLDQRGVSFGAAFGDMDNDGDLDVVYANHEANPTLLRNDSADGDRLIITLRGATSNRFGIGARVRIETGQGTQVRTLHLARGYLSTSAPELHFGLGGNARVNRLTVDWPSGHTQVFENPGVNQRLLLTEPAGPPPPSTPTPATPALFSEAGESLGLKIRVEESFDGEGQPLVSTRFDRLGPALTAADFDGDGRTDLAVGGTGRTPARVFLRSGSRFNPSTSLPPSPVDDGPLLAFDYDGDGRTDLLQTKAGANRSANSPSFQPILFQNTGGGFSPTTGLLPPLPMSVGAAVAADFDRDGDLDLFLGARLLPGRYPLSPRSALLRNDRGQFTDVTDAASPALREPGMVRSALWTDVDADGWVDLLLALEWGGIRYFHNEHGAGFIERTREAGFAAAGDGWWTSLASADFNGDGRLDYAVGNAGLNTPYQPPAILYAGNFKGGNAHQVVEAYQEGPAIYPRRTRKELGAQIPTVLQRFPKNDAYARATLSDLLGADRLSAARRFAATELRSGVFMSQADGTFAFQPLPRLAQVAPAQGMATGDFDGDGHLDLYVLHNSHAPNPGLGRFAGGLSQLLCGDGRGHFSCPGPKESGLSVPGDAKALLVLDLDEDLRPDFLLSRNDGQALAWLNRAEPTRHFLPVHLTGKAGNSTAVGSVLQLEFADGAIQMLEVNAGSGYYSQSPATVYFGWSEANPPVRLQIRWPNGESSSHPLDPMPRQLDLAQP